MSLPDGEEMDFGGGAVLTARAGNVMRLTADGSAVTGSGFDFTQGNRTARLSQIRMEFNGRGEPTVVTFRGRSGIAPVSGSVTFARGILNPPTNCHVSIGLVRVRNGRC